MYETNHNYLPHIYLTVVVIKDKFTRIKMSITYVTADIPQVVHTSKAKSNHPKF